MKGFLFAAALAVSTVASAQTKFVFAGSDTLAGAITDAIIAAGMDQQIQYAGGGSGNGEKGLRTGDQGIAPMSREIAPAVVTELEGKGQKVVTHVLALDGISIFVKASNPVPVLDIQTVARIYTCEFTKWEQIPNSGLKGAIKVYRRNDASGTTDAFKHFTGLKAFGPCVTVLAETADIAEATARDGLAVGYAGLSGKVDGNRSVPMAAVPGGKGIMPTTATIRDFSYPMARRLFLYEISGSRVPNQVERDFLTYVTDRSFMDPIMQAHEFITLD